MADNHPDAQVEAFLTAIRPTCYVESTRESNPEHVEFIIDGVVNIRAALDAAMADDGEPFAWTHELWTGEYPGDENAEWVPCIGFERPDRSPVTRNIVPIFRAARARGLEIKGNILDVAPGEILMSFPTPEEYAESNRLVSAGFERDGDGFIREDDPRGSTTTTTDKKPETHERVDGLISKPATSRIAVFGRAEYEAHDEAQLTAARKSNGTASNS